MIQINIYLILRSWKARNIKASFFKSVFYKKCSDALARILISLQNMYFKIKLIKHHEFKFIILASLAFIFGASPSTVAVRSRFVWVSLLSINNNNNRISSNSTRLILL